MTQHKALMVAQKKWGDAAIAQYSEDLGKFQVSSGYTNNLWGASSISYEEAFREADRRAISMGKRVTHTKAYEVKA